MSKYERIFTALFDKIVVVVLIMKEIHRRNKEIHIQHKTYYVQHTQNTIEF